MRLFTSQNLSSLFCSLSISHTHTRTYTHFVLSDLPIIFHRGLPPSLSLLTYSFLHHLILSSFLL